MYKAFRKFKQSVEFLNILLNNINSGVFILNKNFEVQEINNAIKNIFQIADDDHIGQKCGNVLGCIFAVEEGKNCGDTSRCDDCVLRNSSFYTLNTHKEVYKQQLSRNFYLNEDDATEMHLLFSTKYLHFHDKEFVIVIVEDTTELMKQKLLIERQKKEIDDSIQYSKHILNAIMPSLEGMKHKAFDVFLFIDEKEAIGGDFFWYKWIQNKLYFTIGDCTGHGVPGALLSMLGITLLNDICVDNSTYHVDEILNNLRNHIVSYLREKDAKEGVRDGMDIAFCILDIDANIIEFAGAFNPLVIVNENGIKSLDADRMPIGYIGEKETVFTRHIYALQPNDCLYVFSDGFVSQFGGDEGKKYGKKRFYNLLQSIYNKSASDQKSALIQEFIRWKAEEEQVDDVSVLGIKMK